MKIIKPYYEILTDINGSEILKTIESIARVCYKSENLITEDSANKLVKALLNRGHLAMLEFYDITVKFICDRGCCYSDDTFVLTENGFKLFKDVLVDEKIYTKDDNGQLLLINYINKIEMPYNGDLINFKSTQIDLLVTPNHNCWVYDYQKRSDKTRKWKFIQASAIVNKKYKFSKSAQQFVGTNLQHITIPKCEIKRGFYTKVFPSINFESTSFLKLLGMWITDGSVSYGQNGSGNRIEISQIKETGREYIKLLLINLNIPYYEHKTGYRIKCPQLFNWLINNFIRNKNMKKSYYIQMPTWLKNLNVNHLSNLVEGILMGDGTISKDGRKCIYTVSYNFALDLVEIYLKLGLCANIRTVKRTDKQRTDAHSNIISKVTQYVVNIVNTVNPLYVKTDKNYQVTKYNNKVHCLELPDHHRLYVMRNGKACWCGNSHELCRHRTSNFAQESQRYVNYSQDKQGNEITFISPVFWDILDKTYTLWYDACLEAEHQYMALISLGATPQEARSVLPNSTKTEIVMKNDLRNWINFFKLRTAQDAHPQMRELTIPLLREFQSKIPIVFDHILPVIE